MELRDYIRILRKSWVLILVAALVCLGAAAAYSLTATKMYSATSKVFVSSEYNSSAADAAQGSSFTLARVSTYVNLVTTPAVLQPVLDQLNTSVTVDQLASEITASAATSTAIIQISATDADPATAARIANYAADSLTTVVSDLETPAGEKTSPVKLTTIENAQPSADPVSPRLPLNLALGILVGLVIGVGVAVLRDVLDTRIHSERDITSVTDAPILAGISYDPQAAERPLIIHVDPRSPRAESFRSLRTNLQFLDIGGEPSFVITSSIASEGKSTTSANIAIALADSGKKVALVDADLRKPKIAEYMSVEGGAGLTDVLIGRATVDDVLLPWGDDQLFVLPAGRVPPNPAELLGSDAMVALMTQLTTDFDVVIYDAPPLLPVTDAAVLSIHAGAAIVVSAAGRTTRSQLAHAVGNLEQVGARVGGIVISMVPTKGPDAYGYGQYGYGYGYGPDPKEARQTPAKAVTSAATPITGSTPVQPVPAASVSSKRTNARLK